MSAARLSGCKNYAAAVPEGESVRIPGWGVTLNCGGPVPPEVRVVGIRSHHVRPAAEGENAVPCAVERVVDDVFGTIVLLRPENAAPEAPLLRMELDKADWAALPDRERLTVSIAPADILLLRE